MACLMEKEISGPLGSFITNKNLQLTINKQHRTDLDEILSESQNMVHNVSLERDRKQKGRVIEHRKIFLDN